MKHDRFLSIATLILISFGLLMVYSASADTASHLFGQPLHFVVRQSIYMVIGLAGMELISQVPLARWKNWALPCMLAALILLVVVLIPHIGHVINGSRRWLKFGPLSLQVSECAKLMSIIYFSYYLNRFQKAIALDFFAFIKPLCILALIALCLLKEPDFGATTVITGTTMALLFVAGMRLTPFLGLLSCASSGLILLVWLAPYRMKRFITFLHPWHHQYDSGYQLTQSLIAFGRGHWLGVGLGNGIQKLFYLPEAHTDFLFAVIGEELGLVGALATLFLMAALIGRILYIGYQAAEQQLNFGAYLCYGIATWLSLQTFINMGVNIGLLPTKGLTLPFMSYGGSSLLSNCLAIGLVLRTRYETTHPTREKPR